ncbi:GNAT family N-acetyltransferase [Wenyingzhuangia sp. 1_MG-2023]|nr:GNAT family N-acetyltransferase [Wenyingzhuangia sp. 1_MG-2023]
MDRNVIFPILETDRLRLRQFSEKDIENIFKGLSHPDVIKYYGISFSTLEATKEQLEWFQNLENDQTGIWWAIEIKTTGVFCGAGGFNNLDNLHKKAEIGFWLLPDFWGRGYMKEAMSEICDFGFKKLKLHRIEGFVETENSNCKSGLKKLDFQYEGTMRDCEIKKGGYISLDLYSKLNLRT